MREDVRARRRAGGAISCPAPFAAKARRAVERVALVEVARPGGGRHFGHAAEQAFRRPRAHQHDNRRRAARRRPRRGAARLRASAPCAETSRRRRARAPRKPSFHGQSAQAGFFGVQMVAPRSIIACAKSPARARGVSARAKRADLAAWPPAAASSTAKSRAITRSILPSTGDRRRVERDRRDRGRRVGADARQRAQLGFGCGKCPPWRSTTACAQACRLRARA